MQASTLEHGHMLRAATTMRSEDLMDKKRLKYLSLFNLEKKTEGEYACSSKYIKKESRTKDRQFENRSTQMKGAT